MKSQFKKVFLLTATLLTSLTASAYDVDTHFYATYTMARFAGIKHEVAAKIATGTQWMDESYISDPLSMIILPEVGIKKRRLLHFPGSRAASKMEVDKLPSFLDPSSGVELKTFTKTEADHDFATEMYTEGLMEGNLMKAAVGLHTLEDSFAHAGTIAELGHAHFWHHPDRPYVDAASVEKYFKMSRSVLKALVTIRELLPTSAIDTSVHFSSENSDLSNYQMDGNQLADIYEKLPEIRNVISKNILNQSEFVRFALVNVFERARKVDYVRNNYQSYLGNFKEGDDVYQAVTNVIDSMPLDFLNYKAVIKDVGRPELTQKYIDTHGGPTAVAASMVIDLIEGIVPRVLDAYNKFEKEEDGPVWRKEMEIRVMNMRRLVSVLYGKDIYFVANNTKTSAGYLKELTQSAQANPTLPQSGSSQYITYSAREKFEFDKMIFTFLFPKATAILSDHLDDATKLMAMKIERVDRNDNMKEKVQDLLSIAQSLASNVGLLTKSSKALLLVRDDIYSAHMVPHSENRYFTLLPFVKAAKADGTFKQLLTDEKVKALKLGGQ